MLDALITFAIRVASAGVVFGLQVMLARSMDIHSYGHYATLWTWLITVGSFAAFGFAESSVRFLPRYRLRGREDCVASYWRFGLFVVIGGSTAIAAFAAFAAWLIGIEHTPGLILLFVAIALPFLGVEYYVDGVCRSFGWYRLSTVTSFIIRPLLVAAICGALLLAGVELTLAVVGAVIVGMIAFLSVIVASIVAWRLGGDRRPKAGRITARRALWLKASAPLLLVSGLEDVLSYADVLILSAMMPAEDVSLYFAAARTLALANFAYYAMFMVSGRGFALALQDTDKTKLQDSVLQTTRLTVWCTVIAVAVTSCAGPMILGAFGDDFIAAFPIMLVLGCGLIARSLSGQSAELLILTGRQREGLILISSVLAVNVVLTVALVPFFGVYGAATGYAIAMAFRAAVVIWTVRRTMGLRVISLRLPSLRRESAAA
jgi:O-antigen/teichoic acid export membrane protein